MFYDITYNGKVASQQGIRVKERPAIPCAKKNIEEITIPGRDGKLHIDKATVDDIEIPVTFIFKCEQENWIKTFRSAKSWLYGKDNKRLKMSDDYGFFYIVNYVEIEECEREVKEVGVFTANFHCRGYHYLESGAMSMTLENAQYNPYFPCHPQYRIVGRGKHTLHVNGKSLDVNVIDNVTIDTERKIAFSDDGANRNTNITGDYENLYLHSGQNEIILEVPQESYNHETLIIPNWRCI